MMKYFELLYVTEFVEFTLWRAKNVVSKVTSSLNLMQQYIPQVFNATFNK